MHNPHATVESLDPAAVIPSEPAAAFHMPITGSEGPMADAPIALDREPPGASSTPCEIEYASWVRMLRRTTP